EEGARTGHHAGRRHAFQAGHASIMTEAPLECIRGVRFFFPRYRADFPQAPGRSPGRFAGITAGMRALAFVAWLLPALASAEPLLRIAVYEGPGPIVVQGERLRVRALDDDEGYAPVAGGRLALRLDGDAVVHDGGRDVSLRVRA